MSWKDHIPKEKRDAFKRAFTRIITEDKFSSLLSSAFFYGTHHHFSDFKHEWCDDCLDDSDDRDTKDFAESFFSRLWKDACAEAGIDEAEPKMKKRRENSE